MRRVLNKVWTADAIAEAMRRWHAEHGEPPKFEEWRRATPFQPNATTVQTVFGSWNAGVSYAGFKPRPRQRPYKGWTREQIIDEIFRFRFEHGRLPRCLDWWSPGEGRPSSRQVRRVFGSWNGAIVAAGYKPTKAYRCDQGYRAVAAGVTKAAA